uniref:Cell cycle checkpoint control protein n=1 Tax=Syphacia muris TaxID=451379 RepID=A0A0N5AE08_9BILA
MSYLVFARTVFALNKIGDELYLEPNREGLALRSLNCTKSAYVAFLFSTSFFAFCDVSKIKDNEFNLCRISMKPALMAFKCAKNLEKSILSCRIFVNPRADTCHEIPLLDCTTSIRNIVDKADLEDRLLATPSVMMTLMSEIRQETADITFCARKDSFIVKDYVSKDKEFDKLLKTEIQVPIGEFETYIVPKEAEITVNCKEIKAFVVFADFVQSPLNFYFEEAGSPLVISLENNVHFTAELVVATVENNNSVVEHDFELLKENGSRSSNQADATAFHNSSTSKRSLGEYEAGSATIAHSQRVQCEVLSFSAPPKKHKESSGLEKSNDCGPASSDATVDYADEARDKVSSLRIDDNKFRQYFLSSSQCTLDASQFFDNKSVIASDSDDEN